VNLTARAWKDPVFRATLSDSELAALPAHPVGSPEFAEVAVDDVHGAATESNITFGCCNGTPITFRSCFTCWDSKWTCRTCFGC